ncbi:hypothetical protein [Candidatus Vondammii sp. HM_W22]|uniref:hypothetical protein n=1 Tax=Candidatus Vondammii sp. HM_W22 TaxID=2687299 RepID=UPI002E7BCD2F|nr:hypothetical protein [Candidatus Vondammii sp. HM_W22]
MFVNMANKNRSIHLLVPGLLGPMPALDELLQFLLLELLLTRCTRERLTCGDLDSTLFSLFGVESAAGTDLPGGAFRRIADGATADDRFWLQANPVFLRPDIDRLLLFDSEDLDFSQQEADALATLFNDYFVAEGLQLEAMTPHRWYLTLDDDPDLTTHGLAHVFGRNIDLFLPQGSDAMRWHRIMNETQMLFHSSNINFERESRGKAPINSLWFSGGGRSCRIQSSPFNFVQTDDAMTRGLAAMSDTSVSDFTSDLPEMAGAEGPGLIVYSKLQRTIWRADPFDWSDGVAVFEAWLTPLVERLRKKQIDEIRLYPCNGDCYRLTAGDLRRFWRRRKPFSHWLDSNPDFKR